MDRTSIAVLTVLAAAVCATSASAAPPFQAKKKDPQVFSLSDCTRLRTEYQQAQEAARASSTNRDLANTFATQAANQCDENYTYAGVDAYSRAIRLLGRNPQY
jgi:cytochrome c-type biogenesis protein CcmH/NrfG